MDYRYSKSFFWFWNAVVSAYLWGRRKHTHTKKNPGLFKLNFFLLSFCSFFFFSFAIKFVGTVPNQIPAMMSHQEGAPVFGSLSLPVFANCWEAASWLSVAPGCHHGVSRAGLLWKGEKWGVGRAESTLGRGCPMCILTDGSAVVIYHPWLWAITGWDCIYCFFWFKK